MPIALSSPLDARARESLRAGDTVLLSGIIYTARDAAHARFMKALEAGRTLPVDLRGQTVFYAGPTPPPPGRITGAIGPTTSVRLDPYTPAMLRYGLTALIGKGQRSEAVRQALMETGGVYLAAIGGCAAYLAACIQACEVVAYDDLGPESVKRLLVRDMPLTVAIDSQGNDFYELGMRAYLDTVAR